MKKQPVSMAQREQGIGQGSSNIPRRNYKLLVDPLLKKGQEKLTRFNGETYSCANHGQRPVVVRDPRTHTSRLWSRKEKVDLPVPRYKVDDWYIGSVPPREVTFSKLNDNITKQFMEQLCGKYGKLERVRVYHHPKTDKHMGLAKVVFSSIKSAQMCIERLHHTSIMGNIINAEMDSKGELLKRLFHKIVKGEMMADTMPDVIKHTQEKPQPRPSKIHKQRRKSSTDDPRRKSTDSVGRQCSTEFGTSLAGPRTPPMQGNDVRDVHHFEPQMNNHFESEELHDPDIPQHQLHPQHSVDSVSSLNAVVKSAEDSQDSVLHRQQRVSNLSDLPKPHSLESENESHLSSATLMSDQFSPFCTNQFNDHIDGSSVSSKYELGKMDARNSAFSNKESEQKHKPGAVWTKELENRIESLINEQNQKFNLDKPKVKQIKPGKVGNRHSSSSEAKQSEQTHITKPPLKINRERPPEDLEDGECSGEEEQPNENSKTPQPTVTIKEEKSSVKSDKSVVNVKSETLIEQISPPPKDILRRQFSRSPSPSFRFPASHSPPRNMDRPGFDGQDRYSHPPGEFFHRHSSYVHDRFRHPSPGRPPLEFDDHRFRRGMFEHRPRSPSFDHRRRPSPPFDIRHGHSRSPGFERRHFHPPSPGRGRPLSPGRGRPLSPGRGRPLSPGRGRPLSPGRGRPLSPGRGRPLSPGRGRPLSPGRGRPLSPGRGRPLSPGRGRPPSPGFIRRHEFPPGHPNFVRRRSPSPGFDRRRRSISPRRFPGPLLRREFDLSPRHEKMYFSPHDVERHRREMSPRFAEHERHRKRSPGIHHNHHRPVNIPPSPDSHKLRDHRELPLEFRERWSRQRSMSPPPHDRARFPREPGHVVHPPPGQKPHRSRSSSPETLNSTPPRIRSPARMHPDQKPYSPGDLAVDDQIQMESSVADEAAKRKQRESSDHDAPLISLDERLREITGEAPPEPESPSESSPEEDEEEVGKPVEHGSPTVSEDMEISSGGGGSEQEDKVLPPKQPTPVGEMFRNGPGPFRPAYPGPAGQMWRFGPGGGQEMWTGYNPRFHMNQQHRPMWRPPPGDRPRFPPHHAGFHHPILNQNHPEPPFNNQMLPPPPPGWNRPWVQGQHPPSMNPMFMPMMNEVPPSEDDDDVQSSSADMLGNCVLNRISKELKDIIKRDLNKKVIESMAFKVYEAWWDEQHALKNPKPAPVPKPANNTSTITVKTEPTIDPQTKPVENDTKPAAQAGKLPALLNTFDPLNWAKGSLEMDGFRIGLGFRSAISKMPSFRVKKRTPSPPPVPEKKPKLNDNFRKLKEKDNKAEVSRKRIWLDSEGEEEEEDESEQESSEEEDDEDHKDDAKSRVLKVDEVFSSSSSSTEEESSDEEDEDEEETDEESEEEQEEDAEDLSIKKTAVKRLLEDEEGVEPPRKRIKEEANDIAPETHVEKLDDAVAQAALSLSELQSRSRSNSSPLLSPAAGADLAQQDLRHVHPKKRYRLLSKDETRNLDLIAEVSNKLRSDDEVSSMSDKEKAALEILTDMKSTPERNVSSANRTASLLRTMHSFQGSRFSESSESSEQLPHRRAPPGRQLSEGIFSPSSAHIPSTPGSGPVPPMFSDSKQSGEEELEAVEALLSIKQSQPPIPPVSPTSSTALKKSSKKHHLTPQQLLEDAAKTSYNLSQEDRDKMAALAEEHNYFAVLPKDKGVVDKKILQILEEHNYSCPPSEAPATASRLPRRLDSTRSSLFEADFLQSNDDLSSASAAERVKLRRESKSSKKKNKQTIIKEEEGYRDKRKPSYAKYSARSDMQEMSILYLMWTTGLDLEDMRFLRYEYEQMLTQANVPQWANDTHWTAHPVTNVPDSDSGSTSSSPFKRNRKRRSGKKQEQSDLKTHKSGCARSEGYYKVAAKTKLIQRRLMYRHADNTNTGTGYGSAAATPASTGAVATEKSREARHMMRRIAFEFGADASDLLKYNQLMYRKKSVKFKRSQIHGWGLFAEETIGADEMVIEYVGQLVRSLVADRREVDYTKRGIGSSYLFRIDSDHIIDATKCGNYARFMNHSCDPSCYAKVITVDGQKKIVIYSKNVIRPSDEITYDYKFPIEDDKIPCFCGAINCRGTLN